MGLYQTSGPQYKKFIGAFQNLATSQKRHIAAPNRYFTPLLPNLGFCPVKPWALSRQILVASVRHPSPLRSCAWFKHGEILLTRLKKSICLSGNLVTRDLANIRSDTLLHPSKSLGTLDELRNTKRWYVPRPWRSQDPALEV